MYNTLNRIFKLEERGTTVRTEVLAGITTFLSMAYILAVNPAMLGNVMDAGGVFMATALASAIATFVMAFYANFPIALSAGMGLNAYFTYTVCLGELKDVENAYQIALAAVFVEGIIFILLSAVKFRERVINGIPQNLKYGIAAGIGLFIAFIGLQNAGLVVKDDSTLIALGDFSTPQVVLAVIGTILIVVLNHFHVRGNVLIGILITWGLGMIAQLTGWYVVSAEAGTASVFPDFSAGLQLSGLSKTAFHMNFSWAGSHLIQFAAIVFSFLFVDLFDTVGAIVGLADQAGLTDEKGEIPGVGRILMSDAVGTVVGACLGTSTITSFAESSTGIGEGGRTGLTSLTTGLLFVAAIFLSPIFLAIPSFATAPALIYVGMLTFESSLRIAYDDIADAMGAFSAVLFIPMSYSIANGIMMAVITWVLAKVLTGKGKQVSGIMWVVFALFILRILSLVFHFQ